MCYKGFNREKQKKIKSFETTRPKALIFRMWHHKVDLYQVCSNYGSGAKKKACLKVLKGILKSLLV